MANANSTASNFRPSKDAILRTLERLETDRATELASAHAHAHAADAHAPRSPAATLGPAPRRLASGVYRFGEDYVGLERLDRDELDETDEG